MDSTRRGIAGIDVHKKMLAVVVRRETDGKLEYEKRKFGTTHKEILALAAWLQHEQVGHVVMESTAQYWRPVWYGLEAHFQLHLSHPLKTLAPRGRNAISEMRSDWRIGGVRAIWRRASYPERSKGRGAG